MSTRRIKSRRKRPQPKLSETLIRFAEPLTTFIGEDAPRAVVKKAYRLATTVWNAVVMEQLGHGSAHVDEIHQRMAGVVPLDAHIDRLIERKRERFAHDTRLIGREEVAFHADGSHTVRAETRKAIPPEM